MQPPSKDEGPRVIRHKMSVELDRNLILEAIVVAVSCLVHYDKLLLNATNIITKCDSHNITKCDRSYYKMCQVFYYKIRKFYYKLRVITKCDSFITKCNRYYKMHR